MNVSRAALRAPFVLVGALVVASANAQEDRGDVSQVYFVEPKAGETLQWEAAYGKHVEWHESKKDTWSWPVWEIITGERAGHYAIGTSFHHWKDLVSSWSCCSSPALYGESSAMVSGKPLIFDELRSFADEQSARDGEWRRRCAVPARVPDPDTLR